jgi:hypothetical protein
MKQEYRVSLEIECIKKAKAYKYFFDAFSRLSILVALLIKNIFYCQETLQIELMCRIKINILSKDILPQTLC